MTGFRLQPSWSAVRMKTANVKARIRISLLHCRVRTCWTRGQQGSTPEHPEVKWVTASQPVSLFLWQGCSSRARGGSAGHSLTPAPDYLPLPLPAGPDLGLPGPPAPLPGSEAEDRRKSAPLPGNGHSCSRTNTWGEEQRTFVSERETNRRLLSSSATFTEELFSIIFLYFTQNTYENIKMQHFESETLFPSTTKRQLTIQWVLPIC